MRKCTKYNIWNFESNTGVFSKSEIPHIKIIIESNHGCSLGGGYIYINYLNALILYTNYTSNEKNSIFLLLWIAYIYKSCASSPLLKISWLRSWIQLLCYLYFIHLFCNINEIFFKNKFHLKSFCIIYKRVSISGRENLYLSNRSELLSNIFKKYMFVSKYGK